MGLSTIETVEAANVVAPDSPAQEVLFRDKADGKVKRMNDQRVVTVFDTSQAASEADAGILKLATNAEAVAGADATKAVTSSNLPTMEATRKITAIGAARIVDGWTFVGLHYQLSAVIVDGTLVLTIPKGTQFDLLPTILFFQIIAGVTTTGGTTLNADLVEITAAPDGTVTETVIASMTEQTPGSSTKLDVTTTLGTPHQTVAGASYAIKVEGTTGASEEVNLVDVIISFGA